MSRTRPVSSSLALALALVLAVSCGPPAADEPAPAPPADLCPDLPGGLCALAGVDASLPPSDLAPLKAVVGDAAIVALGESVHRSGGLLAAKDRLTRYLVSEAGFRAVALETEWVRAEGVAAYLGSDCAGDPAEVVRASIRETWHAAPIADLVGWLCAWNRDRPGDPVGFFGFNNFQPWDDVPALSAFAAASMGADAAGVEAGLARCEGAAAADEAAWRASFSGSVAAEDREACVAAVDAVAAHLDANPDAADPDEARRLRRHATSLRGWEEYQYWEHQAPNPNGTTARDAAMAELFESIREAEHPGRRVVMLTHDLHAGRASDTIDTVYPEFAAAAGVLEGSIRMGNLLAEAHGDAYRPIGLLCHRCAMGDAWVEVTPDDLEVPTGHPILEGVLHAHGVPVALADLRTEEAAPAVDTATPHGFLVPLAPDAVGVIELLPAARFDAVVFLAESAPGEAF